MLVDRHEVLVLLLLAHDPRLEAPGVITRGRLGLHVVDVVRIGTLGTQGGVSKWDLLFCGRWTL